MWALLLPSVYCAAEGRLILRNGDGLTEKTGTEGDSKERDKETQQRKGTKRFKRGKAQRVSTEERRKLNGGKAQIQRRKGTKRLNRGKAQIQRRKGTKRLNRGKAQIQRRKGTKRLNREKAQIQRRKGNLQTRTR